MTLFSTFTLSIEANQQNRLNEHGKSGSYVNSNSNSNSNRNQINYNPNSNKTPAKQGNKLGAYPCMGNNCNRNNPQSVSYGQKVMPTLYGGNGLYGYSGYARVPPQKPEKDATCQNCNQSYQTGLKPIRALALSGPTQQYPSVPRPGSTTNAPSYRLNRQAEKKTKKAPKKEHHGKKAHGRGKRPRRQHKSRHLRHRSPRHNQRRLRRYRHKQHQPNQIMQLNLNNHHGPKRGHKGRKPNKKSRQISGSY